MSAPIFVVVATLLLPSPNGELRQHMPPDVVLRAESRALCEAVHAPRIAAEKAKEHGVKRGVVVAECREVKQ